MAAEVKCADKLPHDAYELPPEVLLREKARDVASGACARPRNAGGAGLESAGPGGRGRGCQVPHGCLRAGLRCLQRGSAERHHNRRGPDPALRRARYRGARRSTSPSARPPAALTRRYPSRRAVPQKGGGKLHPQWQQMWITGAKGRRLSIVFARTGRQGDRSGITSFIVNAAAPKA